MRTSVRVLIVEDSGPDAILMVEELRRGGYDPAFERVETEQEMEAALSRGAWDIVLSDYTLPQFSAMAALALLKRRELDIPFVIVTGTIGEETAVRAIKEGVQNYVLKGSLGRLGPVVERELREAQIRRERRQSQKMLRESEARFRSLAETASDAILTVDQVGAILFLNRAAERVFGYPVTAMIGQPVTQLMPDYPPRPRRRRSGDSDAPQPGTVEVMGRDASGREIPLELSFGELVRDGKRLFTVIARDVTERRRAEDALRESEARFRVAAQSASDLIYEWDIAAGTLLWFGDIDGLLGHGPGEFPRSRDAWQQALHPDDRDRVMAAVARHLESGESFAEEYRILRADGSALTWRDSGRPLRDGAGQPVRWIGGVNDVTQARQTEAALRLSEERLRALVDSSPVVLFAIDRGGIFVQSEGRTLEALGLKPGEAAGRSFREIYAESDEILRMIEKALGGEGFTALALVRGLAFEVHFAPRHAPTGERDGCFGVAVDVSEQRRAEQALRLSETRYRALFERNLAGVYRITLEGQILDCNDSFAQIFGYASREEVLGRPAWDFYVNAEDRHAALMRLKEHQSLTNYELCLRRKDGSLVWVLENETLIEGVDGLPPVLEGTVIDISERKRAEEQVRHLAFHDALTGLPNRLLFADRLSLAVAQAHRSGQRLAVLFLDLDRFKVINDSLGHSIGDELLGRVAERLQACVREGDTVARLGGDEFTLLLPGISGEEDAAKVSHKILEAIRLPFSIDERELFVSTSIGVSLYPADGKDVETLVRNADTAMYRAKDKGRDNYQLYTPAMNAKALERLSLENRLRQALQNGELVLHYQPVVELRSGRIRGAEALLRWQHPELGLLPPGRFISLAEMSGLIVPIGEWVLRAACAQMQAWRKGAPSRLSVAVNLSPRQFQQADLVAQVTEALQRTELDPGLLDLEITESNAMQSAEHSVSTLRELKNLGVSISLDDFGSGYSSLNYLKRFPIDRIKIDQSFVRDITSDPDDAAITTAVIAMAHSLKLSVVAEGVETEEQLAFLRKHRCDEMQGYLFSRPLPAREFAALLERHLAEEKPDTRPRAGGVGSR